MGVKANQRIHPPNFVSVPEAADLLGIGYTSAYKLARRYIATDGACGGFPAIRVGKLFLVPVARLEQMHGGPLNWPTDEPDSTDEPRTPLASNPPTKRSPARGSRSSKPAQAQPELPFTE